MHELLTVAEMGDADRQAIVLGVPGPVLMENAGRAVADEAATMVARGARIAVLCGPGNNGGDGFVAARLLLKAGFDVRLYLLGDRAALSGDARHMAGLWTGPVRAATADAVQSMDLVIDALFGAGLTRPLDGMAAELVAAINQSGVAVLAVDVPSGLDGTTGTAAGPVVQARRTVTFFRKKPGHLLLPGRRYCGRVRVADIAIPAQVLAGIRPMAFENGPALWAHIFPRPQLDGHKYARGHAVVVSGPAEQTGAARLGARAALRIGAGLVTLVGSAAATAVNAVHTTAVMVRQASGPRALAAFLADTRRNSVLIGPGASVGAETAGDVMAVLNSKAAVVLDADALTSFALVDASDEERMRDTGDGTAVSQREGDGPREAVRASMGFLRSTISEAPDRQQLFDAIRARDRAVVMTPHDGEFARLFGSVAGSKLDRARAAAALSGAIVVLKGPDTVIAAPDGRAAINGNAPATLATAGSGDVLAGFITGLLAQGMPAFEAAAAAVWLHGDCAQRFGPGLIAEDLSEILPHALRALIGEDDDA
ncbi:MAG: NAD(P)H-hydrate epimerase [Hyphomicrobium sp.]